MKDFKSYPKTLHLFGSKLASNDKMLSEKQTHIVLSKKDVKYVWESKIDGSQTGISFEDGIPIIQNRSHRLTSGEHPQYALMRNWVYTILADLYEVIGNRYIMFGEWTYAKHTILYRKLPHYFHEFDIWDTESQTFIDTELRNTACSSLVSKKMMVQVPIVHVGQLSIVEARKLMNHRPFYGEDKPEGLYLKIEKDGVVIGRYKLVHDDFIQSIIDSDDHWKYNPIIQNHLIDGFDITRPGAT